MINGLPFIIRGQNKHHLSFGYVLAREILGSSHIETLKNSKVATRISTVAFRISILRGLRLVSLKIASNFTLGYWVRTHSLFWFSIFDTITIITFITQVKGGGSVGIAVYGTDFSWINHSCSPNACYRFLPPEFSGGESRLRITPVATAGGGGIELVDNGDCNKDETTNGDHLFKFYAENDFLCSKVRHNCNLFILFWFFGCAECKGYGPRVVVRSIKAIKKGEEVSIAYTDLLQPKVYFKSLSHVGILWSNFSFYYCSIGLKFNLFLLLLKHIF